MDGINTFFVSWAARQVGLKVALSGLGGDEVFGGYNTFRNTPRIAKLAIAGERIPRGRARLDGGNHGRMRAVAGARQSAPMSCEKLPRFGGRRNRSRIRISSRACCLRPRQVALLSSPALLAERRAKVPRDLGSLGSRRPSSKPSSWAEIPRSLAWSCGLTCSIRSLRDTDAMSMQSFARSSRSVARSPVGGVCRRAPGQRQAARRRLQGVACGGAAGPVAGRGRAPAQAHFYVPLGALAARPARFASGDPPGRIDASRWPNCSTPRWFSRSGEVSCWNARAGRGPGVCMCSMNGFG